MPGQGNFYDKITKRGIDEGSIEPFEYLHVQFPDEPGAPLEKINA